MSHTAALHGSAKEDVLNALHNQFTVDDQTLFKITQTFFSEISDGLSSYDSPTFVKGVPDGSETGTFLALDLGGTNLRVCEVTLLGDQTFSIRQQKYKVSETLKTGEVTTLFDYLADSVDAFLTDASSESYDSHTSHVNEEDAPYVSLALTFSFPVEQSALDSGVLLTWTKGFSAKNAIGKDVVKLLQDAFDRKHIHVKCVALVNDTVGALLSRAYTSGGCILGAIFGTGTNGAYVEEVSKITKLGDSPAVAAGGEMIVNTEWGAFNNSRSALPTTPYDNKLDRESINPGFQAFEKFISGMYLGEIARNVILSLIDAAPKPLLFGGQSSALLNKQWGLDTAVLSEIEEAWEATVQGSIKAQEEKLRRIQGILAQRLELSPQHVSLADADIVRQVCTLIASRAARMSGTAVAAILVHTGPGIKVPAGLKDEGKRIGVGVDGSLVEFYPNFQAKLRASLRTLVGPEVESHVDIGMAKDGSGAGAALCALVAQRQSQASHTNGTYAHDPEHIKVTARTEVAYLSSLSR
ncbi:uncharacterized protein EDB91DRAFT_1234101 [Suillus paluster]|uniref:uncharacterized protein n=1 Tax=Suillus paluster TaxID=48578 RepID=UPI001B8766FE|nr:uncharacterized protein EDB91DRAFT_1234101 [Suillus paluster]KAG1753668.1 hypothetical protein EDB91DRAFT_1234101 [Suillus paluster]